MSAGAVPPQLKSLRTVVVERMPFLRRVSAKWPPIGTMSAITACGSADRMPLYLELMRLTFWCEWRR